ncbi:MAG: outer membrane lipoprotein-sorting protein [Pleomorphochaeta sp.]
MKKKTILCLLLTTILTTNLFAIDVETIIEKYDYNSIFNTSILESDIIIKDSLGTSRQKILAYSRKNGDTLIEITEGPDSGQKVLRLDSSIFLYYPEANQIIRLQGAALKESFMGSDFSYEDLSGDESVLNKFDYKLIEETDTSYIIQLDAKSRKEPYQKQLLTIDKETFVCTEATLMSSSGRELRKMMSSDIRKVGDKYVAFDVEMIDLLKNQGSTTMKIESLDVDVSIDSELFTTDNLSW